MGLYGQIRIFILSGFVFFLSHQSPPSPSSNEDLKIITKVLPTKIKKQIFEDAHKLGFNETVGCMNFAIIFPSIVNEVMKTIPTLPFIFYTHPKSQYKISAYSSSLKTCRPFQSHRMHVYNTTIFETSQGSTTTRRNSLRS